MTTFLGLKIVPHPLARDVRTEFKVVPWGPVRKKRRNWRVVEVKTDRPGCFKAGSVLYMHPELVAKLPFSTLSMLTP